MSSNVTIYCCLCCLTTISLAVFFGIFFGINYPEIKRAEYIPTMCQCLSTEIVTRFCCRQEWGLCRDYRPLPPCKQLVLQSESLSPFACNENSALCPKSDSYCDGGCCTTDHGSSAYRKKRSCSEHFESKIICDQCYDAKLNMTYYVGQHQQNSVGYIETFSKLYDANVFISSHEQNSTFECFYNPSSVTEIILGRSFTHWKWTLFAFPAFALLLCLVTLTNLILRDCNCVENKTWRWSIISFIWIGIIIPLIIFLQVRQYGLVSQIGLIVLMIFILLFIAFGSFPIAINFLIFCGFSLLQAIFLSFIGLIIPLVYVSIILYVPSSKKIIFQILSIQLTLVLLTIIFKLKREDLIKHIMYL